MHINTIPYPTNKQEFYKLLTAQLSALTEDVPHLLSNLSNASALLGSALTDINWVGFYLIPSKLPEYFPLDKISDKKDTPAALSDGAEESDKLTGIGVHGYSGKLRVQ